MDRKPFLAAGDVLINPAQIAYVAVETDTEGPQLRLGFAGGAGSHRNEIRLAGIEARSVLKWLRSHAEFLDAGLPTLRPSRNPIRLVADVDVEAEVCCLAAEG